MAFLGIYLGIKFAGRNPLGSLFDFLSFAALFLSLLSAWLFSVWENDEADREIDQISNPDRPLLKKELTIEEWRNIKYLFLFLALSFAFLGGLYLLTFTLLFLIIYHFYSAPPLRLKRFFGISSLLIAGNALIAVWMGFFMAVGTENLRAFPIKYIFGILIIFFLAEHVKNLKDIEGDKKNGIQTLPVLLGPKKGKLITGIFVFFATLLTPIVFYPHIITLATAIFFGIILFFIINAKKFKEKYVFIVYFIFAAVFISEAAILSPKYTPEVRAAIAGWQWLYKYDKKFLDPAIPFRIKIINDKYCHSPNVEIFWKNISKEFENHYYLAVFERFFSDRTKYKTISNKALTILKTPQVYYNDVLPQALYCDLYPVREDFTAKTFDKIETETGYDLTHKFLSAIFFKENGCSAKGYNLDKIISTAAQRMIVEQEVSKKFDDLYAERTAFLLYYGFKDLVKEDWIKNIVNNQSKSGAWATPTLFEDNLENPHTTVLAIWALTEYSKTCPFQ